MAEDIRLLIVQYFGKALSKDEDDVRNAIQDPAAAVKTIGGTASSTSTTKSAAGGKDTAGASGASGQTASTSTEAYAVQYVVGKWTTDNQLATSVLKSMNDAFIASARNT